MNNKFFPLFSENDTSGTPREIIHFPEGIEGKEERKSGNGQNVEDHPTDHIPLASEDEDQGLETVNGGQHDQ